MNPKDFCTLIGIVVLAGAFSIVMTTGVVTIAKFIAPLIH